jgi:hypothetical protein
MEMPLISNSQISPFVTSKIILNDKIPNPQGTTQGTTIRILAIVTSTTYPLHFMLALLWLKGGIPNRISKAKQ